MRDVADGEPGRNEPIDGCSKLLGCPTSRPLCIDTIGPRLLHEPGCLIVEDRHDRDVEAVRRHFTIVTRHPRPAITSAYHPQH